MWNCYNLWAFSLFQFLLLLLLLLLIAAIGTPMHKVCFGSNVFNQFNKWLIYIFVSMGLAVTSLFKMTIKNCKETSVFFKLWAETSLPCYVLLSVCAVGRSACRVNFFYIHNTCPIDAHTEFGLTTSLPGSQILTLSLSESRVLTHFCPPRQTCVHPTLPCLPVGKCGSVVRTEDCPWQAEMRYDRIRPWQWRG